MNEPNASFVTGWAEIRNGATSTVRTGPSPSAGNPAGSSVPMRNVPPGMSSRSALNGPSPASTSRPCALPDRGVGASGVQQGPPIVQIIVGTRPLVAVDRGRQPVWTMGLARSGEGGAIMPEVERVRTRLPIPDPTFDGDVPFDARDPRAVFPPIEPLLPPEGAPNVLIVLLDDVGFAASSA